MAKFQYSLVDEALNRTGNIGKFSDEYVYYMNVLVIIAAGQRLDDNNRRLFTLTLNLILNFHNSSTYFLALACSKVNVVWMPIAVGLPNALPVMISRPL